MNDNSFLEYNNNPIRRKGDKYCLSDMAKPYGKKVAQWMLLDSTMSYVESVSQQVGNPTSTILSVKHGKPAYAHLYVALHFAQWLDSDFYAWFNIMAIESGKVGDRERLERSVGNEISTKEISETAKATREFFGESYAQIFFLKNMERHQPRYVLPQVKSEDMASSSDGCALLTPTEIAKQLGISSGQKVNKILERLGYQEKIGKNWSATKKAISANLCKMSPVFIHGKSAAVDQLKWYSNIIDIISEHSV